MFIKTEEGRLQNLMFLQDVIVVGNEDGTYSIGYVQVNGEVIKEGTYDTAETAESKKDNIINDLLKN